LAVIVIVAVLDWTLYEGFHQRTDSTVTPTTQQTTALANDIATTLYKPSSLPHGYQQWTVGIDNKQIDASQADELGKFLPTGRSALDTKYIKNLSPDSVIEIFEAKDTEVFNPSTDCVTPGSVNVTTPCQTVQAADGSTVYMNQSSGVAFMIKGTTFIYISFAGVPVADMLAFANTLVPTPVAELGLSHPLNTAVDGYFQASEPPGGYSNPF
jgi:hypothetical protein